MSWEKVACDLCGGTHLHLFLKDITTWEHPGKFNLVKCQDCGLVFFNPRPSKKEISQYYPDEYWGNVNIKNGAIIKQDGKRRRERDQRYAGFYKIIFKQFPQPARILDIGCGTGGFLTAFKEKGWRVLGTEISTGAANFSQKSYGFQVRLGDLLELDFAGQKFDVVVLNGVLEHVFKPSATLKKVHELLAGHGLLIVLVPNIESFGAGIFKKDWWPNQPPRHLYHFSPETLAKLFIKTGFKMTGINHSLWFHNYYCLFESFRFHFSPKFQKEENGGLGKRTIFPYSLSTKIIIGIGKIVDFIFSASLAQIGALFARGEVFIAYAKKS